MPAVRWLASHSEGKPTVSEQTKTALDAALAAHVADECDGGLVTGYVCQAQFATVEMMDDETTGYLRIIADGQNLTTTIGLVHYAQRRLDACIVDDED